MSALIAAVSALIAAVSALIAFVMLLQGFLDRTGGRRHSGGGRDAMAGRVTRRSRLLALGALVGVLAAPLVGAALGYGWMLLFPRPDFRFEETPVLAGVLVGLCLGPGLGAAAAAGRAGGRRLAAGAVTMAVWIALVSLAPHTIGAALAEVPEWVSVPVGLVAFVAGVAGTGGLAGRLVKQRP